MLDHLTQSNVGKIRKLSQILFTKVAMCCGHVVQLSSLLATRLKATGLYLTVRVNFFTCNCAGHKLIIIHSLKNRIDNWYQHVLYNDFVFLQFLSPLYDDKSKTLLWCQLSALQPGFPSLVDSLHLQKLQKQSHQRFCCHNTSLFYFHTYGEYWTWYQWL